MSQIYLPGDPLPSSTPGLGTHLTTTTLVSSLAGTLSSPSTITSPTTTSPLPQVGDIILGTITRLTPKSATLDIQALTYLPSSPSDPNPHSASAPGSGLGGGMTSLTSSRTSTIPLPYAHQALIRQQDIRATEIDKVTVPGSFQVGDIVRAVVISIGDERNYYCSTARDELGVVLGRSERGTEMVGVSWAEMVELKDGEMGRREGRKVAKVI
ncbi:Exosome component EXOSC1/CSL4-like protein [Elsinoe fawcettii]|nr:Exosome component EXOSC1/CSL4-like protein [Elsinoe fawcettii]